jgi:hypothetical protein
VNDIENDLLDLPQPPAGVVTYMLVTDLEGNVYRWPLTELVMSGGN